MRGGLGVTRQRFHTAERHGIAGNPHAAQEFESGPFSALELDGKESARVGALFAEDSDLLRILKQSRVDDAA